MIKKNFLYGLFCFTALVAILGTWSFSRAEGGVITSCVKSNGLVYVIGEGFKQSDCLANDKFLSWNIQGSKGDKGDKGDPGEPGSIGPTGKAGSLTVNDSQGQVLGIFVQEDQNGQDYRVWLTSLGGHVSIKKSNGQSGAMNRMSQNTNPWDNRVIRVVFSSSDCTGQAYFTTSHLPVTPNQIADVSNEHLPTRDFYLMSNQYIDFVGIHSAKQDGNCIAIEEYGSAYKANHVELPFTLPVAVPLFLTEN